MKKISLIYLGIKGVGTILAFEMFRVLSEYNSCSLVIISQWIDNLEEWDYFAKNRNVKLLKLDTYTSKNDYLKKTFNIGVFFKIRNELKTISPDCIYSPMSDLWQNLIFSLFIPKGIIRVRTIHDLVRHKGEDSLLLRVNHKFSFFFCEKIVVLSRKFVSDLNKKGIDSNNIIVIPHPNLNYYVSNSFQCHNTFHNRIMFFGRIVKYKGLDILLSALKIVVKTIPSLKIVIAGAGDTSPYTSLFNELRDNLELKLYEIPNDEIASLFGHVDYLVLPYIEASQSGVIPLAYSFGKPVIASDVGAISEQVTLDTGILVEPGNVEHLASAIIALTMDRQRILSMSVCAKKFSQKEMKWEAAALKLLKSI